MKTISPRQEKILNTIVGEYIKSACPVSSKFLEKKYHLGICPATIRNEMQKLSDAGFISQPHTSAGRIPTDKGYRFFVNKLLHKESSGRNFNHRIEQWIKIELNSSIGFLQAITKNLSLFSSNLVLGYLFDEKILWKDGWGEIIKEPEFSQKKIINNFISMIEAFEQEVESLNIVSQINSSIKVYIGKENPFARAKEFSIIATRCSFKEKEDGILAILGPKRMDYNKNINSLNSLIRLLENESFLKP